MTFTKKGKSVNDKRTMNGARINCPTCYGSGLMPWFGNFVACTDCFGFSETYASDNTNANGLFKKEK